MPTYIVFVVNAPAVEEGVALPDPTPVWAVLKQGDAPDEAVEAVIATGTIPAHGEIHACDTSTEATVHFTVETAVTVTQKPSSTPPVEGTPPTALFTYTPASPSSNDMVQFDANQSTPGSEPIARYDWLFGDEAVPDAGATPTYQFTGNGDYDVVLTVTDEAELTNQSTQTISI
jgi:PKD repeat protein